MEEISDDVPNEASCTMPSKDGNGSSRNPDKRETRENSELSCKSERKAKRRRVRKWQTGLNKKKNKRQGLNLNQELCSSSSSILSNLSMEASICTSDLTTTAIAEKVVCPEKTVAYLTENLVNTNCQNQVQSTSAIQQVSQGAADAMTLSISTQRLEKLQPSLTLINEMNFTELILALRNCPCLPEISEQWAAYYANCLLYQPSNFNHLNSPSAIRSQIGYIRHLVPKLSEITNCSYYWGKMDPDEAEKKLDNKPAFTFLLRDSIQREYLFSVSCRTYTDTFHKCLKVLDHKFSFVSDYSDVFSSSTVCGLLEDNREGWLKFPLHRTFPFSLKNICRTTITDCVTYNNINQLELPKMLKSYLKEYHYEQKICVRHLEKEQ